MPAFSKHGLWTGKFLWALQNQIRVESFGDIKRSLANFFAKDPGVGLRTDECAVKELEEPDGNSSPSDSIRIVLR
jgi:hypothetical protein